MDCLSKLAPAASEPALTQALPSASLDRLRLILAIEISSGAREATGEREGGEGEEECEEEGQCEEEGAQEAVSS